MKNYYMSATLKKIVKLTYSIVKASEQDVLI